MKTTTIFALLFLAFAFEVEAQNAEMVPYNGKVEHLFFHPLVAFPELMYKEKTDTEFIDSWFCTVPEFKSILEQLYERGYVLIDQYEAWDKTTLQPKPILLPPNKKPFVLSVDDLNFYPQEVVKGTNRKLFVDENGNLATYGFNGKGEKVVSNDSEVVTIVENFIAQHPDFSIRGARGIVAVTGFYGFFGYATHHPERAGFAQEQAQAKAVADKLKALGWRLASHSWSHKAPYAIDDATFVSNETKWLEEAAPILGPTDLYIYPFGAPLEKYTKRMAWLKEHGFRFFYLVSNNSDVWVDAQGVHLNRIPVDGKGLRGHFAPLANFMDPKKTIDKVRPPRL